MATEGERQAFDSGYMAAWGDCFARFRACGSLAVDDIYGVVSEARARCEENVNAGAKAKGAKKGGQ